ncbi:TIGR02611 family protein [Streptomyces sp. SPB074]|uniref:TIGR02611 family protein n=1 Tax=Streptomyces sp. (strain SPB074) TaxID=465543 RepID=UPI00017F13EF|nr:TIGR02611 family protein [Streptomyces sp. SPB074]EDY43661.1 membrane protein [Streptomyces sp. SPB074]
MSETRNVPDVRDQTPGPEDPAAGTSGGPEPGQSRGEGAGEPAKGLGSRAPRFVRERRTLHLSWQVGVFVVGLAVVAAGVLMLVLPGPGWVVIFGGMAIWATEFVWAQLVLRWTKRKVAEAAHKALDPEVRRRNIILTSVGLLVVAALVLVYVIRFGLELPWNIEE